MKHLYRISLFFNAGCLLFAAYSYGKSLFYTEPEKEKQAPVIQNITVVEGKTEEEADTIVKEEKVAVASQKAITTCDTVYIVESYDKGTKESTQQEETIPDQGKN